MNNIEKNLSDIMSSFYYQDNINKLLLFLSEKHEKIMLNGKKEGLTYDPSIENEFIHRLLLEGVPFFLLNSLKETLKSFEESISSQPLLLAHPSGVKNKTLLSLIDPSNILKLIQNDYVVIAKKLYDEM